MSGKITHGAELSGQTSLECDVCVIGSGAGGAVLAAGLVERRPDASDRRVHRLYLSQKARPILDEMVVLANQVQDEALKGLTDADREQLKSILTVIKNNLIARQSANDTGSVLAQAGGDDD